MPGKQKRFQSIDKEFVGRVPPQAQDVEMAVLGAMMRHEEAASVAIEILKDTDFYVPAHRKIFGAMQVLFDKSNPIDMATTANELEASGDLEKCGGRAALIGIADTVFTAANIRAHSLLVKDKSTLRSLIGLCQRISESCFSAPGDVGELIEECEAGVLAIAEGRDTYDNGQLITNSLVKALARLDEYRSSGGRTSGVRSGIPDLDRLFGGGFDPGDLILIAGRPSMGKTSLALNIIDRMVGNGVPVCMFSLEMSRDQIVDRLLSIRSGIDLQMIRSGRVTPAQSERISQEADAIASSAPLWIDDSASLHISTLRSRARRLRSRMRIGCIVVDYLGLVRGNRTENRNQEVSDISRGLKSLAKELSVPVLALSQLSRDVDRRAGDRRPMLADLRDSGSLEQDADSVVFVYRPEKYGQVGQAELIVAKQRNGPIGVVKCRFVANLASFDTGARDVDGTRADEQVGGQAA